MKSERWWLNGWPPSAHREGAAGLLICTTASDSEGTLGGLVALSEPPRLQGLVSGLLRLARADAAGALLPVSDVDLDDLALAYRILYRAVMGRPAPAFRGVTGRVDAAVTSWEWSKGN